MLVPEITLTVAPPTLAASEGVIGEVANVRWEGMRHEVIASCQGWYYTCDRVLMLWEVDVRPAYQVAVAPIDNVLFRAIWEGFERYIRVVAGDAEWLVTPSWEPRVADERWQAFLVAQSFALSEYLAAFMKVIVPAEEDDPAEA